MVYEAELHFLQATFEKCHLQTLLLNPLEPLEGRTDMGLRAFLEDKENSGRTFYDLIPQIQPATIYKMTDSYLCCYMFLMLPDTEDETILFMGPYLPEDLTHKQVMERAEKLGVAPRKVQALEKYYGSMPVLAENSHLFVMLDVFGEHIWGGSDKFTVVNID